MTPKEEGLVLDKNSKVSIALAGVLLTLTATLVMFDFNSRQAIKTEMREGRFAADLRSSEMGFKLEKNTEALKSIERVIAAFDERLRTLEQK